MKRVRGDEPEASAVVNVDRGEGDAPVVVDAAEAGSSSGTRAALRRAVTVEGSAQPAVADEAKGDVLAPAAQADDQGFDPKDPYYRHSSTASYMAPESATSSKRRPPTTAARLICPVCYFLYKLMILGFLLIRFMEDSEDIDSDKEDRDRKSRFVLKKLKTGQIPFRRDGKPNCPFCGRVFPKDIESLIQHATGVGKGSAHKHKAASKAKHAAFGKFLRDYVKTGLIPLVGPAVGPHVLH
ncbi:hypothetical protein QYE76_034129 [Lolium multiflorum]|uniref:Zinc finger-XS domain-containing protein n=1 Tax=Lolium multiflorum TaxID=4521 RepID=A0AAD8QX33_LOLMU|nr:hypothetical protein QYE76_034129 [Lolium multiflorum]